MRYSLDYYTSILRQADDRAGGGAGDQGAGAGGEAGGGAEQGSAGADTPPAASGESQPPAPPADGPHRPDGLPETMFGEDDRATIDKMAEALKGYRAKDGAVKLPEAPDGYLDFTGADVKDELKPYVEALGEDPVFKAVGEWAFGKKMDQSLLQEGLMVAYGAAAEGGFLSPMIDPAAEQAALVPENLKGATPQQQNEAAKARVDAAEGFVKLAVTNGTLPKEIGEHGAMMLLDTANGVKFLEWAMASQNAAAPSGAGAGGNTGGLSVKGLSDRAALPENTAGNPKFDQGSYDQLQADYKKFYGD